VVLLPPIVNGKLNLEVLRWTIAGQLVSPVSVIPFSSCRGIISIQMWPLFNFSCARHYRRDPGSFYDHNSPQIVSDGMKHVDHSPYSFPSIMRTTAILMTINRDTKEREARSSSKYILRHFPLLTHISTIILLILSTLLNLT
jgi:hypothetical protein